MLAGPTREGGGGTSRGKEPACWEGAGNITAPGTSSYLVLSMLNMLRKCVGVCFPLSVKDLVNVHVKPVCVCLPAVVLTQRVSTAHFCKSISDQSLLVLETLVLQFLLCMDQWAGMGGIASAGREKSCFNIYCAKPQCVRCTHV